MSDDTSRLQRVKAYCKTNWLPIAVVGTAAVVIVAVSGGVTSHHPPSQVHSSAKALTGVAYNADQYKDPVSQKFAVDPNK